jgi:hypothetical protein
VQSYVATRLAAAGYRVTDEPFDFPRYAVDYQRGHEPSLTRLDDGHRFTTESAFYLGRTTGSHGVTCMVRAVADVRSGDCGYVTFRDGSPEWTNDPFFRARQDVDEIVARGGVGAVVEGDLAHAAVYSVILRESVPSVVALASPADVIGRRVRLRAMGHHVTGRGIDVVGVRRPASPSDGYVVLLAHADGWFQAAADNGSGTAAVLRAAELIARDAPRVGVVVATMDAEEVGLLGSHHLADVLRSAGVRLDDGGPPVCMSDLKAVVNLDASSARASDAQALPRAVVGADAPLFSWRALVASEGSPLGALFAAHAAADGVLGAPVTATAWVAAVGSWRTDAGWFYDAGVPVVWPVVGYPEYHTNVDDLRVVDPVDLEAVARAAAGTVADAARLLPLRSGAHGVPPLTATAATAGGCRV